MTSIVFIKILQINTNSLVVVLITLAVTLFLLSAYRLLKNIAVRQRKRSNEIRFGNFLNRFSSYCDLHYRTAKQMLNHYLPKKGNEFDAAPMINNGKVEMRSIVLSDLFKDYLPTLSGKAAPRVAAALTDTFYQVKSQNENMDQLLYSFRSDYEDNLKEYFTNIYELSQLHDELREFIKGKSLNKASGEWVNGFLNIFGQWLRNGGSKDMEILYREIILKVLELNRSQPGNPFSSKTNEKALKCEFVYNKVSALDDKICKSLSFYIGAYKKASKLTGIIGRSIIPEYSGAVQPGHPMQYEGRKFNRKERILAGAGLLMICAICFSGGLYLGSKPQRSHSDNLTWSDSGRQVRDSGVKKDFVFSADTISSYDLRILDSVPVIYGLDISRYQGNLLKDINQFDSLHFVICKATQGTSHVDSKFHYNWKRLKELNIIRGAYHFYMTRDDPTKQARHFLETVGKLTNTDIPLILDIEELSMQGDINATELQSALLTFMDYLETQTGRKPIIYTDLSFADSYLRNNVFSNYPLWLAEYSGRLYPKLPVTWKEAGNTFWQKTDTFRIDSRKTDLDIFNGNGAEFTEFIKQN